MQEAVARDTLADIKEDVPLGPWILELNRTWSKISSVQKILVKRILLKWQGPLLGEQMGGLEVETVTLDLS